MTDMNNNDLATAWKTMPLSNDFMFCRVMSNPDVCAELLRRLLHIPVERVEEVHAQKSVQLTADSRGVRFDVYVKDSSRVFDIEVQVANQGDLPLRARYYQGSLDVDMLKSGEPVTKLKESYIVFLCLFDPFKHKLPVYTVQKTFAEKSEVPYTDGTNTVFFNCRAHEAASDVQVRNILSYLVNGTAKDGFTAELERYVERARQNGVWEKEYMTLEMIKNQQQEIGFAKGVAIGREAGRSEGIAIGEQRGERRGRKAGLALGERRHAEQTARNMLNRGFSVQDTAEISGLSEERVRKLAQEQ